MGSLNTLQKQGKQFEQIYLQTYPSVLGYTLKKCGKTEDIEDISICIVDEPTNSFF